MPVRRVVCGLAAVLALGTDAFAQPAAATSSPPAYAILSLVGDQFTVVIRREETGSRLDQNIRKSVAIDSATLDDMAIDSAAGVLKRLKPVSPVLRFSIRDRRLFDLQDKLFADSADSRGMRDALAKLAREHQATRLVVVTKWRDDARFRTVQGTTGSGKIAGLGFYVDPFERMSMTSSGEGAFGFLGPYAYLNVTVVDVASMAPVRAVQARESEMNLPVHSSGAVNAWETLTPAAKVDALERVLRRAVAAATAAAIAD
ncbi:MAG: hypothetical protein ACXWUL_05770 [Caldimonas sp.]